MKRKILMFLMVSFIAFSSLFYAAFEFGYFNIESVNVNGLVKLDSEEVVRCSKVKKGQNLITLKLSQVEQSIMSNPYVKDVYIEKDFPRTLDINIVERMEFFCVPYMGSYVIIDEEGMALRVENDIKNIDRPVLTGIDMESFRIGKEISLKDEAVLSKLLNLLDACLGNEILENISEINIDENSKVRLYTFRGIVVLIGDCEQLDYKIPFLREILTDLYKKNINYGIIDMRHNGYPVYRQHGGEIIEKE